MRINSGLFGEEDRLEINFGRNGALKKLSLSSAMALCEDEALRDKITEMINRIKEENIRIELSMTPEAALPLTIAIRNGDEEIQEYATDCLRHILESQENISNN